MAVVPPDGGRVGGGVYRLRSREDAAAAGAFAAGPSRVLVIGTGLIRSEMALDLPRTRPEGDQRDRRRDAAQTIPCGVGGEVRGGRRERTRAACPTLRPGPRSRPTWCWRRCVRSATYYRVGRPVSNTMTGQHPVTWCGMVLDGAQPPQRRLAFQRAGAWVGRSRRSVVAGPSPRRV